MNGQYDFLIYVSDATLTKEKTTIYTAISANRYKAESIEIAAAEEENFYASSYMILFKNGLYVALYNGSKLIAQSYSGDFLKIEPGTDLVKMLLTVEDSEGNLVSPSLTNPDYENGVLANYKALLNKSYATLKVKNTWITSAIYLGVFFGLSLLMGFHFYL